MVSLKLLALPSFRRLPELLLLKMREIKKLLNFFIHEVTTPMKGFQTPEALRRYRQEEKLATRNFLEEVHDGRWLQAGGDTLETEPACELSLILAAISTIVLQLGKVQH